MFQSTGNKQLDGAALEAYSQWRFQPGTGSQVKIPIEFAARPKTSIAGKTKRPTVILYPLLILVGFGLAGVSAAQQKTNMIVALQTALICQRMTRMIGRV